MQNMWIPLSIAAFLGCFMAPMAIEKQVQGQVKVACYAAQAEAIKQHVEFKQDCSK